MNSPDVNFKIAFESEMEKYDAIFQHDGENIYSIALKNMPERIITIRLICSQPIDERIHGSKNNTEITAIGYFTFKWSTQDYEPNFFVFAFRNIPDNKVEFAVIPYVELKKRLELRKSFTINDHWVELKFWLMPTEDYLFETTNLGAEGEWWWCACGRMSKHIQWDYTEFLNRWDQLATIDKLPFP